MPSGQLAPCTLLLDTLGLSLSYRTHREVLVPRRSLGVDVEDAEPALTDYFVQTGSIPSVTPNAGGHLLVLIRAGDPDSDEDYREVILAIPWPHIDAAMRRVWKQ